MDWKTKNPELAAVRQKAVDKILPDDFWNLSRPKDNKGNALKMIINEREEGR